MIFWPIRVEKLKVAKFEGYYCRRYYVIQGYHHNSTVHLRFRLIFGPIRVEFKVAIFEGYYCRRYYVI